MKRKNIDSTIPKATAHYKWDTHYVNSVEEIDTLEQEVAKWHNTRFSIDELRFKTLALRQEFQKRLVKKFLSVYSGLNVENEINMDRLFPEVIEYWDTPYGRIKISDIESLASEQVK